MSEKKGPFDAAIKILRDSTIRLRAFNIKPNDIDFAIRVLEAAGKIDRDKLMDYLDHVIDWKENDPYGPGSAEEDRQLRALLEALPEKEGK